MRQTVIGLLAHVDAGKTTLAEAMLFEAGAIRKAGRVDHGDAYLDFDPIERERGITVFSKQARLEHGGIAMTLLDAPGHVDFSAEMERVLQVVDMAVLVIAQNDGVTGHTRTLWRLLDRYQVPTVIFVNKCDLAGSDAVHTLDEIRARLDEACFDYGRVHEEEVQEALGLLDERALEEVLEEGRIRHETLRMLFACRLAFPCLCGSALHDEGVIELLDALAELAPERPWPQEFSARAYKVTRDERGERLTWLKVTGGVLRAKEVLEGTTAAGKAWRDKVDQLRLYHGARYQVVGEVKAGQICAATGLSEVLPTDGLGAARDRTSPVLTPVLDYAVSADGVDVHTLLKALQTLAEEDPLLAVGYDEHLKEVRLRLMGAVQTEVVSEQLSSRFQITPRFGTGSVLYKETIDEPVEGIGHFEPLRHYAEVHLLLEPLPQGSGVRFGTACSEDVLDRNWQRLILTHVAEREHRGVLIGAPLTDVRITLVGGRAHAKHTEGGDFRQATYRAIRAGLMRARSVLLEPWYRFELEVGSAKVGRALADLQRMSARFDPPQMVGDAALICGYAPVSEMSGYALEVAAYTSGTGSLTVEPSGYEPAHDGERVIEEAGYEPEADLPNTPDSVFCSHGAGYTVKWYEVEEHAHIKCADVIAQVLGSRLASG